MTEPPDIDDFQRDVERHWRHHAPSYRLSWDVTETEDGWRCEAAPALQEVVGSARDGETVWAGFGFDLGGFSGEHGMNVETVMVSSRCVECSGTPNITIQGDYFGVPFDLRVHLEPLPRTPPLEFIDDANHRLRGARQ